MKQFILFSHKQRWVCALLLLPLGEAGRSFAQQYTPFPTDSAQWSVRHIYNNSQSANSFQYKMKGDTLLNGITYHKIYYSLDLAYNSPNQTLHCFVREDTTKKVFVKYLEGSGIDTTEFMLYNFNLAVGDTTDIRLLYFTTDSIYKLQVTAIDSFSTNTGIRRYYRLTPIFPIAWYCTYFMFDWRVGIGSTLGPFYNEIPEWGCDDGGYEVSCFWHRGVYVWGGTFCDYTTDINEIKTKDNDLQIYPNPNNGSMMLDYSLNTTDKGDVTIYDIAGKLMYKYALDASANQLIISHKEFNNGIYFYRIKVNNKIVKNDKIVIIKQ